MHIVRVFSPDIKMEFDLSKCALLIMSRGEVVQTEQTFDAEWWSDDMYGRGNRKQLFWVLKVDGIKHEEMKELMSKEYCWKMKVTLESELNDGNIVSKKDEHCR